MDIFPEDAPTKVANPDHFDIEGQTVTMEVPGGGHSDDLGMSKAAHVKTVVIKVVHRVKYAPLTYTSIIGFSYSLMAFK